MVTTETGQVETRIVGMTARCETPGCGWTHSEPYPERWALLSVQANGHDEQNAGHHVADGFDLVEVPRGEYGRYEVRRFGYTDDAKTDAVSALVGDPHDEEQYAALTDAPGEFGVYERRTEEEINAGANPSQWLGDCGVSIATAQRIARALSDADERATWAVHSAFVAEDIGVMPAGFGYPSHPGTVAERDAWMRKHASQIGDAMTVAGFETIAELLRMDGVDDDSVCDDCGHAKHRPGECEYQEQIGADPRGFETCGCDAGEDADDD